MVLEATIVCVDNSDWMRNGDYTPTRLEAQNDAVNLICSAKTQSNPENTVGLISGASRSPEVLVTLTSDLGKVLTALHGLKLSGSLDIISSLQVAQLALKHRQNKNQQQRIIIFVGSPITVNKDELVRLAKRLKKNNVAVDVVNFGEEGDNTEKLEAFVNAINSNDNSHLVTVPSGPHILSDLLLSSPIITGAEGGEAPPSGEYGFSGGVDPNLDPELALALKISMEEERARQEASIKESQQPSQLEGAEKPSAPTAEVEMTDASEDDELAQALRMSMQQQQQKQQQEKAEVSKPQETATTTTTTTTTTQDVEMERDLTEEEEMQLALQMSMAAEQKEETKEPEEPSDINKVMEDPNFVNSVLSSLPGVDPNDERIKNVLKNFEKKDKDDKK